MKGNRFKQDNRGASLLAVLVLMVVVSLIAVVITKITIVNIEMKEVERGTKKNFYSADELMDNLRAGARELAEAVCRKPHRSGSWCVGYHGRFRQCGIPGFRL